MPPKKIKYIVILVLLSVSLFGCSKPDQAKPKRILLGMWSEPSHKQLREGMEIGKARDVGFVGIFSNKEFGVIDLYCNGTKTGSFSQGGTVINAPAGIVEIKGKVSEDMILISMEEIEPEVFKIIRIVEVNKGPLNVTIDDGIGTKTEK